MPFSFLVPFAWGPALEGVICYPGNQGSKHEVTIVVLLSKNARHHEGVPNHTLKVGSWSFECISFVDFYLNCLKAPVHAH